MKGYRLAVAVLATVIGVGTWAGVVRGQLPAPSNPQLPGAPVGAIGEAIFPAFEAWGPLKDGQNTIMIGYYNRNKDQALDIPVGPNNRLEPGGPDMGQPTHFEPGRHYGVFSIPVPKDAANRKYTWTIVANGQTSTVQLSLNPPVLGEFLPEPVDGEHAADHAFRAGWQRVLRTTGGDCRDEDGDRRSAAHAEPVGGATARTRTIPKRGCPTTSGRSGPTRPAAAPIRSPRHLPPQRTGRAGAVAAPRRTSTSARPRGARRRVAAAAAAGRSPISRSRGRFTAAPRRTSRSGRCRCASSRTPSPTR